MARALQPVCKQHSDGHRTTMTTRPSPSSCLGASRILLALHGPSSRIGSWQSFHQHASVQGRPTSLTHRLKLCSRCCVCGENCAAYLALLHRSLCTPGGGHRADAAAAPAHQLRASDGAGHAAGCVPACLARHAGRSSWGGWHGRVGSYAIGYSRSAATACWVKGLPLSCPHSQHECRCITPRERRMKRRVSVKRCAQCDSPLHLGASGAALAVRICSLLLASHHHKPTCRTGGGWLGVELGMAWVLGLDPNLRVPDPAA